MGRLLADFGHDLPTRRLEPQQLLEVDPFNEVVGRRGRRAVSAGWAAVPAPLSVWRMTSEQAGGVWPLIAGDGLPASGALLGVDLLTGGAFHADPVGWTLTHTAGVSNPNLMIFGAPGRGKSALVKMFCLRMMAYGYSTLILGDVKDEYAPLCTALGVAPLQVGPGLPARINPLDPGPTATTSADAREWVVGVFTRWLLLIRGLVGSQGVPFGPSDEAAVGHALRELTGLTDSADRLAPVTIPLLWHALAHPSPGLVEHCRYRNSQAFLDGTRPVRDALGALVHGHLAGLFDAPTSITIDWAAPIQSLSLSRLEAAGDDAVGVALTCLNSWGRAITDTTPTTMRGRGRRIVVRDEAWKQLRLGAGAVASLDADLRLSRRDGTVQIVIAHKPSDLLTVGDTGSQAVAIARDLLHLCATKVLLGQDEQVGDDLAGLLGLTPLAQQVVTGWATAAPGRALWLAGNHAAKVQTLRTRTDLALTDTNHALTNQPTAVRNR